MSLLDDIIAKEFLGPEFLVWLWYRSEAFDGAFDVPGLGGVTIHFEDSLILECLEDAKRASFKGGDPATSDEARTTLVSGSLPAEAKLRIIRGEREWMGAFKSRTFDLQSLKMPLVLSKEDDDRFYERMYLLDEVEEIIEGLFHSFLKERLSTTWGQEGLASLRKHFAEALPEESPDAPPWEEETDETELAGSES